MILNLELLSVIVFFLKFKFVPFKENQSRMNMMNEIHIFHVGAVIVGIVFVSLLKT